MSFRHLPEEEIDKLYAAAVRAGFNSNEALRSLQSGINPFFRGRLPAAGGDANFNLLDTLGKLNRTEKLVGGEVPLLVWLRNAARLTTGQQEGETFRAMLSRVGACVQGERPVENAGALPELRREIQERVVHFNDMVPFGFLRRGHEAGLAVARVEVPRYDRGQTRLVGRDPDLYLGSGWLIAPELLVTNQHVVKARPDREQPAAEDLKLQAAQATARFDYEAHGARGAPVNVERLEASDIGLDYAVLRLKGPVPGPPGSAGDGRVRRPLPVRREPLLLDAGAATRIPVNIIQHPDGDPKKLACRNNLVSAGDAETLRYFTDTRYGSSGSPVLDDGWRVVALHRGSQDVKGIDFQGRAVPWVNVGTQTAAILARLRQTNPALYDEVAAAQKAIGAPGW